MRTLGIFSGSKIPSNESHYRAALESLGKCLPTNTLTVAYGGGNAGLMGIIPTIFDERGGAVVGYNAKMFIEPGVKYPGRQVVLSDFSERQRRLITESDIILVLPGGVGTVFEIFEVLVNNDLNLWKDKTSRPVILYNIDDFFTPIYQFLVQAYEAGFIHKHVLDNVYMISSTNGIIDVIQQ